MTMRCKRYPVALLFLACGAVLYGQGQDILPSQPPRLSREELYHLQLSGNVPASYWAGTMKTGQTKVIDGVVYRKLSGSRQKMAAIAGTQATSVGMPQDDVTRIITGKDSTAKTMRLLQRSFVADWLVKRDHGRLPRALQDTLRDRFRFISGRAADIQQQVSEGRLSGDEGQKRMANLLARVLLEERDVYRRAPSSFRLRYGTGIDSAKAMPAEDDLGRSLLPFITGKTLERKPLKTGERLIRKKRTRTPDLLLKNLPVPTPGSGIRTIEYDEVPVEYAGLEGRIFVAEHPVLESWEWGIVHSSIVAGIWILKIERKIVETREVPPTLLSNSPGSQESKDSLTTGKLIGKTRYTIRTWQFYDWAWANGCVGSYADGDTLRLTERISGDPVNDLDLIMKLMNSYTPDDDTNYCFNRATSYSLGLYGLNYVCHQSANAFMRSRRGYEPVTHWYSLLLYGMRGTIGTSTCSNKEGFSMRGCIPGNWCEGNHIPYINILEEPAAALVESAGVGDGYGLGVVWHPTFGWIISQAIYNNNPVTISPDDDPPEVLVENLPAE